MQGNDSSYYVTRAEQEEEAARVTTSALVASIHLSLASRYRAKASECEQDSRLSQDRGFEHAAGALPTADL